MESKSFDSDHDLVRQINNGNKAAFEKLYRTNYVQLCDFIYRYVDSPDICEELVQDLFLSIWSMKDSWNPKGTLRSYLYKGVKNRALDYLKHREVEKRYLREQKIQMENDYLSASPNPIIYEVVDHKLADKIEEAIEQLPERGKLIFNLSRENGLTYCEIADFLDISVKTVETQMGRNFKKLRKYLFEYLPVLTVIYANFQNLV